MECVYRWCVLWCVWEALSGVDKEWGLEQIEIKTTATILVTTKGLQ